MSEKLWCIRIPGPDDVYAMDSRASAEKAKAEHDAAIAKWYAAPTVDRQYLPTLENMLAVVEEWPHGADEHAEAMDRQEWPVGDGSDS